MDGPDDREPVAEANADYGNLSGGFVRLDVRLETLWDEAAEPLYGWTSLSPDEAEALARKLVSAAAVVRRGSEPDGG